VDLDHYPDPYIGDLRGSREEPRLVFLGLNPGIGYDELQGDEGVWTRRIRDAGYSRCFERSPAEDPSTWQQLHNGRDSAYWRNVITFARRWLDDPTVGVQHLLNFEIYPWHSRKVAGRMQPPAHLIDEFIWKPVEEVPVREVFAFGRVWLDVCRQLGLTELATWGPETERVPGSAMSHWRVSLFQRNPGQLIVASSQMGSGAPPGAERVNLLRKVVADHQS
jgi:hypothetical protein